jgi:hypothetical protein
MTRRIALALVLHNHQPVGNFGWVLEDVHDAAYEPMLAALERHPSVAIGLHYSGALLSWMEGARPAFLARLRALVARGQVEVLGGGRYEPILPSIPSRDRVGQLGSMAAEVERVVGRRPPGAWLAERVWEPDLPGPLVDAGYEWTILDDAHFRAAAVPEDAMWGPYTTDDQRRRLTVFATEQGLRYRIPFEPVERVIEYLHEHATEAGERVGMMGDDGEKFGAWPSTFEHCWGKGRWVDDFFEALEANADWLATTTPSAWLEAHPPIGRVYVPTSSYAEMGEWVLPPEESAAFGGALRRARALGLPEARWLRGGFWRNFQSRYREINDLHKQMLRVSAKVASMPDAAPGPAAADRAAAVEHLYRGQSNDVYWHGLFGGIYIPHLRAAVVEELIGAEDLADQALGSIESHELADLDLDGRDEIHLATAGQVVTVKVDEGAGIGSWDLRAPRHALAAVLRRRPEAYHRKLLDADAPRAAATQGEEAAPASIHEAIRVKEPGLAARLRYDAYERRSGLIRALPLDATPASWAAGGGTDLGDPAAPASVVSLEPRRLVTSSMFPVDGVPVTVTRMLRLGGGRMDPSLDLEVVLDSGDRARTLKARIGLEWALTMLGGGGNPAAWWQVGEDAEARTAHDSAGSAPAVAAISQGNDWLGVVVTSSPDPAADAWWAPIETISNSEGGFERVYQGSALLLSWVIELAPGARWSARVRNGVLVSESKVAKRLT